MFAPEILTPTGLSTAPWIAVEREPARIETLWRDLERSNPGRLFQRYDWVAAWLATQGRARNITPAIVLALDDERKPRALFPFGVKRWRAVSIVSWAGDAHSTFNMPLLRGGPAMFADARQARAFLRTAGRAIGDIDAFALYQQPLEWDGAPHLFIGAGDVAAADAAFERALGGDGEALIARILSSDARRKLRNKERRLADSGAFRIARAKSSEDLALIVDAFLEQKRSRFHKRALHNPFAEPGVADFLHQAATEGLDAMQPGISFYALMVGDRVGAVFGGPEDEARFSAMFTSFDMAPEIARYSPGDVLLRYLVSDLSSRGVKIFDLGIGEAQYKHVYCDRIIPMFETHLACTPAGLIIANLARARTIAKRIIKRHPSVLTFARRVLRRPGE